MPKLKYYDSISNINTSEGAITTGAGPGVTNITLEDSVTNMFLNSSSEVVVNIASAFDHYATIEDRVTAIRLTALGEIININELIEELAKGSIPLKDINIDDYDFRWKGDRTDTEDASNALTSTVGPVSTPTNIATMFTAANSSWIRMDTFASVFNGFENGGTITAWVYLNDISAGVSFLQSGTTNLGDGGFRFGSAGDGKIQLSFNNEFNYKTTLAYDNSKWTHVAISNDGSGNLRFSVNGVFDVEYAAGALFEAITATTADIGSNIANSSDFMDGVLKEIRYYSRKLSDLEVSSLASWGLNGYGFIDGENLRVYYNPASQDDLTEAAGLVSILDDLSVSGSDNLLQNTGIDQPIAFTDRIGNNPALDFTQQNLETNSFSLDGTGNVTFHFLADLSATQIASPNASLFSIDSAVSGSDFQYRKQSALANEFLGEVNTTNLGVTDIGSLATDYAGDGPHVFSVRFSNNDGTIGIYIDGVLDAEKSAYNGALGINGETLSLYLSVNRSGFTEVNCVGSQFVIRESDDIILFQKDIGQMAWFGGIQSQLPIGHAYEDAPPQR